MTNFFILYEVGTGAEKLQLIFEINWCKEVFEVVSFERENMTKSRELFGFGHFLLTVYFLANFFGGKVLRDLIGYP